MNVNIHATLLQRAAWQHPIAQHEELGENSYLCVFFFFAREDFFDKMLCSEQQVEEFCGMYRFSSRPRLLHPILISSIVIAFCAYLLFDLNPRHNAPFKVASLSEELVFDLASSKHTAKNAGDVVFLKSETLLTLHFANSTQKNVNLQLISKSCGCINVPEKLQVKANARVAVELGLSNQVGKHGKQRISLVYGCTEQDRVLPIEINYNSVIPVRCLSERIHPSIGKEGTVVVDLESSLKYDLPEPLVIHSNCRVVSFAKTLDGNISKYRLELHHPKFERQETCLLQFSLPQYSIAIQVPVHLNYQERYVIRDVSKKASSQDRSQLGAFTIQRLDGKPFKIQEITSENDIQWERTEVAPCIYRVMIRPGVSWKQAPSFMLTITTDMDDQTAVSHWVYPQL